MAKTRAKKEKEVTLETIILYATLERKIVREGVKIYG